MRTNHWWRPVVILLAAVWLTVGCDDDDNGPTGSGPGPEVGEPVPDFSPTDVNDTSSTFEEQVSPRDFQGAISAWYFGSAT